MSANELSRFATKGYSQLGEEGMIAEILRRLKIDNGWFVEFGALDGKSLSNTYALAERGWSGVYIEGSLQRFIRLCFNMLGKRNLHLVKKYVSCEKPDDLNTILGKIAVPKDFDVLSLDVDGNDYWILKSLTAFTPKLVIIEYNSNFEPDQKKTIEYDPNFRWGWDNYFGASAGALNQLAKEKGYTLIAFTALNLFFLKNDLMPGFEPLPIQSIPKSEAHPPSPRVMIDI
jgi:hypothetical protein